MSLFIFSALLSALLVWFALRLAPRPRSTARFPAGFWIIILAIAMSFLFFLWGASQQSQYDEKFVHSIFDIIQDSANGEVLFGFMFGIFFSIWLNTIYMRKADEPFAYRDAVVAVLLVLFLILGAGGRGFVPQLFARMTDLKLPGGAELTLSSGSRDDATNSETSHYTLVPPTSSSSSVSAPDASGGLQMFRDIPAAIRRDALYYALSKSLDPSWTMEQQAADIGNLTKALEFAEALTLEQVGNCLQDSFAFHADDKQTGDLLAEVARRFRSLAYLGPSPETIGKTNLLEVTVKSLNATIARLEQQIPNLGSKCKPLRDSEIQLGEVTKKFDADKNIRFRPYLWIAAASGLAYHHDYSPAIKMLDDWIRAAEDTCPDRTENPEATEITSEKFFPSICEELAKGIHNSFSKALINVFKLRVRTLIASYIEEWNNVQPLSKTLPVLRYHAENISAAIDLAPLLIRVPLPKLADDVMKINFANQVDSSGDCTVFRKDPSEWPSDFERFTTGPNDRNRLTVDRVRLAEIVTVDSLKRDWLQAVDDENAILKGNQINAEVANQTNEEVKQNRITANTYASDLVRENLFCLQLVKNTQEDGKKYVNLQRAKANFYFARVLLQGSEDWADEISTTRLNLLKHGLQSAQSALLRLRPTPTIKENLKKPEGKNPLLAKINSTEEIEISLRLEQSIAVLKKIIHQ